MARVMAVSFTRYGRLYYLDAGAETYAVGEQVLVPTEAGPEVAECVWAPESVGDVDFGELPLCARASRSEASSTGTPTTGGGGPRRSWSPSG